MAATVIIDGPVQHFIALKGPVPSKKNSKRRIKRGNHIFMVPSAAHEVWHAEQLQQVRWQWPKQLVITKCTRVEITFTPDSRRSADLSNKAESVMDLLVDAGVLADDNWFVVPELILRASPVDKNDPKALITITI